MFVFSWINSKKIRIYTYYINIAFWLIFAIQKKKKLQEGDRKKVIYLNPE
jgi:hypothetical protein